MPTCVCSGAAMCCSFGVAPATLLVLPTNKVNEITPAATILDNKAMINIPSFGMCNAPTNPAVIATTAAAWGVPTPAPCIPSTVTPWAPGNPKVMLAKAPILTQSSKLNCLWMGIISINQPGQNVVQA